MENTIPLHVLEILEWPVIQEELSKRCSTSTGKKIVASLAPLEIREVRNRLRKITQLKEIIMQNKAPDFYGVTDIEPFVALAEKDGVLKLQELVSIKMFVTASGRMIRFLKEHAHECPSLTEEYSKLNALEHITRELVESITDNDELSETAFPELRRIKNELHSTRQEIEKKIGKLIRSPAMDSVLQEKIFSTRNERYVILVKSNLKDRIKGTVHDISASGATYYIEPADITPLNNRLISLGKELQVETEKVLRVLSKRVSQNAGPILNNLRIVSYLDFLTAASHFSMGIGGSEPEISDRCEIKLIKARHPILYLISPQTVISNDIELGVTYNCLIISGANTGGKTVILKTIGLCSLLAMHGLHVPAGPDSRIGIFRCILADIGDDQSISQSLSTFSGQIVIINQMLREAGELTLVIIDEIVVGTNPRQGAALACAILESLIETGSRIVVTTHYSELKRLPSQDPRFCNASVSFDLTTLRPTYRLITGLPGVSYAIEIAKNYGIPTQIVSRANDLLDAGETSIESLIETIQKHEQEAEEEKLKLADTARGLDLEKKEYEERFRRLERRSQEIQRKEGIDFLQELAEYRGLVSERIKGLQQMNLKQTGSLQNELMEIEQTIRSKLDSGKEKLYSHAYIPVTDSVKPGQRVFILSLEKEGTVEHVDYSKKNATVLLGGFLKSTFRFEDLYEPASSSVGTPLEPEKHTTTAEPRPDSSGRIPSVIQTSYNTVDLRGKRVDEGIRFMEQEFDRMMRSGIGTVVVIHGHGTGAMKKAVRETLQYSLYVNDFRPGELGEGGDGVTIVRLKS